MAYGCCVLIGGIGFIHPSIPPIPHPIPFLQKLEDSIFAQLSDSFVREMPPEIKADIEIAQKWSDALALEQL